MTGLLLTPDDAAAMIGISSSTLNKMRVYGGGPPFYKLGRSVRYLPEDIVAWLEKLKRSSTSESA